MIINETTVADASTIVNMYAMLADMSAAVASTTRVELPLLSECCSSTHGQALGVVEAEALASLLRALADPARLRLISLIAIHPGAEACVCDLITPIGLSQPTVSHHLKVLVEAGMLTRGQRGKWAYYRLVPQALNDVARAIALG